MSKLGSITRWVRTLIQVDGIDLALVCAVALLLGGATLYVSPPVNHDVAAILAMAERMLHGDVMYVDRIEPNPPLAFLMAMPVIVVARALQLDVMVSAQIAIILVNVFLVVLFARVCRAGQVTSSSLSRHLLVLGVSALVFGFKNYELGQREPLMIIAALPYLAASVSAVRGVDLPVGLRWAVGVVAGLGLALKPQFLLLAMVVELYVLVARRDTRALLRVELLALVGVFGGFYLWTVLAYRYVGQVLEWKDAYHAYDALGLSYGRVLSRVWPVEVVWALPFLAFQPRRDDDGLRRLMHLFVLAGLVSAGSVVLQGKGFGYHIWPVQFASWGIVLIAALRWWPTPIVRIPALLSVVALVWHVGVTQSSTSDGLKREAADRTYSCPARSGRGKKSKRCSVPAFIDAVKAHTLPGDRVAMIVPTGHPFGWVMAGAGVVDAVTVMPMALANAYQGKAHRKHPVRYHDASERGAVEQRVLDLMVADLDRHRPKLVIIDHRAKLRGFGKTKFDLYDFYAQDPAFVSLMETRYQEVKAENVNGSMRFFRRVDTGPARVSGGARLLGEVRTRLEQRERPEPGNVDSEHVDEAGDSAD